MNIPWTQAGRRAQKQNYVGAILVGATSPCASPRRAGRLSYGGPDRHAPSRAGCHGRLVEEPGTLQTSPARFPGSPTQSVRRAAGAPGAARGGAHRDGQPTRRRFGRSRPDYCGCLLTVSCKSWLERDRDIARRGHRPWSSAMFARRGTEAAGSGAGMQRSDFRNTAACTVAVHAAWLSRILQRRTTIGFKDFSFFQ